MLLRIELVELANVNQLNRHCFISLFSEINTGSQYVPTMPVIKQPTVGVIACKWLTEDGSSNLSFEFKKQTLVEDI